MVKILRDEYSLGELEERLEMEPEDIEDGLSTYVEENYDKVLTLLREDLWFD